jgi:hypothetical protein
VKAAVLHEYGAVPRYEDFPDPVAGAGEVVVEVKAVAVENIDKAIAAGTHFAARQFLPELPAVVGSTGSAPLPTALSSGSASLAHPTARWPSAPSSRRRTLPPRPRTSTRPSPS